MRKRDPENSAGCRWLEYTSWISRSSYKHDLHLACKPSIYGSHLYTCKSTANFRYNQQFLFTQNHRMGESLGGTTEGHLGQPPCPRFPYSTWHRIVCRQFLSISSWGDFTSSSGSLLQCMATHTGKIQRRVEKNQGTCQSPVYWNGPTCLW